MSLNKPSSHGCDRRLLRGVLATLTIISSFLFHTLAASALHDYANVGLPVSTVFSAKQHGGHNQNWTSIQSDTGLVYVGHTDGVSQYDGENWFNLPTPHLTPVRSITQWNSQLYIGTTNDLAHLQISDSGKLIYKSLLQNHALLEPTFGEVWSTAANSNGVVFVSSKQTFFYNGNKVSVIDEAISGKHAVFTIDDVFYYKPRNQGKLYRLASELADGSDDIKFTISAFPGTLPKAVRVMEILKTPQNLMTVVTEKHGIYQYQNNNFIQIKAPEAFAKDVQLYDAILSSDGYYYISSTYHGLFVLDQNWQILRHYREPDNISMDTVLSVNEDLQGNIWLTGIPNIVKMRPPHIISEFKAGNTSTEILRLQNTSLGIIASGNGVFKLQPSAQAYGSPSFVRMSENLESSVDLIVHKGKLIKPGHGSINELTLDASLRTIVKEEVLMELGLGRVISATNQPNKLVLSSSEGAFLMDSTTTEWHFQRIAELHQQLISLNLDKNGNLWLGSDTGNVYKVDKVVSEGTNTNAIVFGQNDGLGPGPVELFDIDGKTVISSAGKLFVAHPSIPNKLVLAQLPMLSNEWLAESQNIDQLLQTPASDNVPERIWYRKNGESAYFEKQENGQWLEKTEIFKAIESGGFNDLFVSNNNIVWFVRDKDEIYRVDIQKATQLPAIAPVNIRSINGQNEAINFLNLSNALSLSPEQKDLRFTYASADSSSPKAIEYRTRFGNDNAQWSNWSQETYRDFTLTSYGDFMFEVQAKDAWDRVSSTKLAVNSVAPWYLTKVAYAIYIVVALLLILVFTWFVQKWRTLALEAKNRELENKVAQRTQEVNEKVEQLRQQQILKDRFFGNVSHEFRTPLTLTIGPLEVLMNEHKDELSAGVKHLAKTALNNASKMLALVGQVLDLNRLEAGKLPLRITQHDIAELIRNTSERFETWADQHEQSIKIEGCDEPLLLWFDIDQFEKCVSNLLSNAIKYSGNKTTITVQLSKTEDQVMLTVADNGVGISDAAKSKVFERFYQDKSSEQVAAPGTGIGLALVKEIMEIHSGKAELLAQSDGGCCFALTLKTGTAHFDPNQIIEPIVVDHQVSNIELQNTPEQNASNLPIANLLDQSEDLTTLLVVDDNKELLNFISLRLSATYKILQANNGQEGLEVAKKELPDLIISDVNMPKMTGLELAHELKQDSLTKTIPIILLTAKATKREIVEGFSVGADDYLTKPFDTSELIVRVNAQINARKLIRQTLQSAPALQNGKPMGFAEKAANIIHQHLAEPEFNVEKLAQKMHMSRDTLTRKCKKEYSETPLNLIINARMVHAQKLLKQNSMSISEVAYASGFESLAYFSKSFKKHTGSSPSQLATQ